MPQANLANSTPKRASSYTLELLKLHSELEVTCRAARDAIAEGNATQDLENEANWISTEIQTVETLAAASAVISAADAVVQVALLAALVDQMRGHTAFEAELMMAAEQLKSLRAHLDPGGDLLGELAALYFPPRTA